MAELFAHGYRLPHTALERSLVHVGQPNASARLLQRLRAGKHVTIGVLGASVAQNGGCLTQPGQRCMAYNGEGQKAAGFAVRLLRLINASFPHPGHRIANAARDATPAQSIYTCLFTRLPTHADLVILEFGSLALHLQHWAAEAIVRALLALPAPPVVAFFTIRNLCYASAAPDAFTVSSRPNLQKSYLNLYAPNTTTAWTRAELTFSGLCSHYGVGCVSLWNAIFPHMYRREANFSLPDVASDCLHPITGRFGVEYSFDTLAFWFKRTMALGSAHAADQHGAPSHGRGVQARLAVVRIHSEAVALPPPMISQTPTHVISSKCLSFGSMGSTRSSSTLSQGFLDINWRAANVHSTTAAAAVAPTRAPFPTQSRADPFSDPTTAVSDITTTAECDAAAAPSRNDTQGFSACAWLRHSPCPASDRVFELKSWALCTRALGGKDHKRSMGVVAVAAGAMLEMVVDTRVTRQHARKEALVSAVLEHLVSYEGMGVASLTCVRNCKCAEQRVNSLVVSSVHNESVFLQHVFNISGAHPACVMRVTALGPAPGSSGAKVKLRSLILT